VPLPLQEGLSARIYVDPIRGPFEEILREFREGDGFRPYDCSGNANISGLEFVSCWLYLPLENRSRESMEQVLEVDYRWVDRATLYRLGTDGSYSEFPSGQDVPLLKKAIPSPKQAFRIHLAPGESREYFLYLRDYYWLNPSLTLWKQPDDFLQRTRVEDSAVYTYLGLLGGLFVMNVCVYIVFRYKDILYYLYYLMSVALLQVINFDLHLPFMSASSLSPSYSGKDLNYFLLSGTLSLSSGLLILFSREFLQLNQLSRRVDQVAQYLAGACIVIAPLFMFGPAILLGKLITPIVVGIWATGNVLSLGLGFYAAIRKQSQAKYFIPALLFLFLVAWRFNLSLMTGSVATAEILMQWLFASGLEMMIFAFALSERFFTIEQEKGAAREAMRVEMDKHAKLQQQYNERLESEVQERTSDLEESNHQKDEILRIIAHDLKSPIDGVKKLARLLSNTKDLAENEIEMSAREIRSSATHLSDLTKNLLDWGQLQGGRNLLVLQPYLVDDLREQTEQTFQAFALNKGLSLEWSVPRQVFASFDFNGIATVLRNLISNASKYSQAGQVIRVEGTVHGKRLKLSVIDEGKGMSSEQIDRISQRLKVESTVGTAGEQGGGIGLQICQDILKAHKTELSICSMPDRGTCCSFTLEVWTEGLEQESEDTEERLGG